jgi:hypothetical protein
MNRKIALCAWAGVLGLVLMGVGEASAWRMPAPLPATLGVAQTAAFFRDHRMGMLVGGAMHIFGLSLYFVFTGGLAACFRKMEGAVSPLTNAYLMMTPFGFFTVLFTTVFFVEIAFRPDLPDATVYLLADLAFLMLTFTGANGVVLFALAGLIVLGDRHPQPIFPRWTGWLALVVAILSAPACLVVFFKSGPFAWDGALGFQAPTLSFAVLIVAFMISMFRAARHPAFSEP